MAAKLTASSFSADCGQAAARIVELAVCLGYIDRIGPLADLVVRAIDRRTVQDLHVERDHQALQRLGREEERIRLMLIVIEFPAHAAGHTSV